MSEYFSPNEIAKRFKVSDRTVYRWLKQGVKGRKLAAMRVGGSWRINDSTLMSFFDHCKN